MPLAPTKSRIHHPTDLSKCAIGAIEDPRRTVSIVPANVSLLTATGLTTNLIFGATTFAITACLLCVAACWPTARSGVASIRAAILARFAAPFAYTTLAR